MCAAIYLLQYGLHSEVFRIHGILVDYFLSRLLDILCRISRGPSDRHFFDTVCFRLSRMFAPLFTEIELFSISLFIGYILSIFNGSTEEAGRLPF